MSGLSRFAVAVGLAIALPSAGWAGGPGAGPPAIVGPPPMTYPDRAKLRQAIEEVRQIREWTVANRGRLCIPAEDALRDIDRTLRTLETAYHLRLPLPYKLR